MPRRGRGGRASSLSIGAAAGGNVEAGQGAAMHIPLSYAWRMADPAMKQHYAARLARAQTDAPFSSGTLFLEAAFQLRDELDAGETPSPRIWGPAWQAERLAEKRGRAQT
ncbi:hypothetical protein ATO1_24260 [Phaeobacter sp. 22II1-1F12B]|nr:hypothetical protein ATO1_24260 [Phaeobacter sp. 22II1-1F12B]